MPICYRFLGDSSFSDIHQTFVAAFADYHLDMSYMTEEILFSRAVKNGIDLNVSVGAFDAGELVGCTLIGVGRWRRELAAFDIATGVKKPYRGLGLASGMFEHALPQLRGQGVTRFVLEVLQENESAVKAYRKAGFEVVREFDCYRWEIGDAEITSSVNESFDVVSLGRDRLSEFVGSLDWAPSWENSFAAIDRIPGDVTLLGATREGEAVGLLVYHPGLRWIMSWVVLRRYRRRGIGTLLAKHLVERLLGRVASVKALNVLSADRGMAVFLGRLGFEVYVSQFEMERAL